MLAMSNEFGVVESSLPGLAHHAHVSMEDCKKAIDKFLAPDGSITKEMMPDALHPTTIGYRIWADAISPLLDEMMK